MSTPAGASSAAGRAEGIKKWWRNATRKEKAWTVGVACVGGALLLSLVDGPSDSDEYAAAVEKQTMQAIAGVDTPGDACSAGYDWTCDVTKTDYKPYNSVYVYTELPAADAQSAQAVAYAYYMSVPDLEEVVVINRGGGEFPGTTRQELSNLPGL